MKHSAKHLDSGFYIISDKAAGALVRALGHKLPKFGHEKFVMLRTSEGVNLNAWLQRTDVRHSVRVKSARGWVWAVYSLRRDNEGHFSGLGASFTFEALNSSLSVAA